MSSLIVQVTTIDDVRDHPQADKLALATVGGWQVVIPKDTHVSGEKIVFFPPDTILPKDISDHFGVTQYLSKGRIKHTRLRGEPSFGLVVPPDKDWPVGTDVADYYGATKYEPPRRQTNTTGKTTGEDPRFTRYTDIENLRHYPDLFDPEDEVYISEKIHGANCRIGVIDGEIVAGSRRLQRAYPVGDSTSSWTDDTYWTPWIGYPGVRSFLRSFIHPQSWWKTLLRRPKASEAVIIFGEVFGPHIQSFDYGLGENSLDFRAFDIMINGQYVNSPTFYDYCDEYSIPYAPVLFHGAFGDADIPALAGGKTTVRHYASNRVGQHIREGVVIKPATERQHPKIGRLIAKFVSDEYLLKDKKTDYTEE